MKQLKVDAINNGTVIDHIPAGNALKVFDILNTKIKYIATIGMNLSSKALGKKDYTQAIDRRTPDNVIMFVPNIAIYLSACEQIPDLVQQAWKSKVTICPPEAVYPILKNIMLTWQQKKLYENAEIIQKQAIEIHKRLIKFQGIFAKIGTNLNKASKAFNEGTRSWNSRLTPAFRKIEEMGVVAEKKEALEHLDPIEEEADED